MKKLLFIAILAVFAICTASAQSPETLRNTWQKTITVPESQAPLIDKLFMAWGKEFPGVYLNVFNQFKATGKTKNVEFGGEKFNFKIDYKPKNGDLLILSDTLHSHNYYLEASYWALNNGNKLFGISVYEDRSVSALAFYEYNSAKGTLSPRPDLVNKLRVIIGEENAKRMCVLLSSYIITCLDRDYYKTIELDDLLEESSIEESIATEKDWQKTITVPELPEDITLDLFMVWCDEFPSWYSEAFNKIEETGKVKPIVWDGYKMDISLFPSSLESLCMIGEYKDFKNHTHKYLLNISTWTLKNGNPLFGVSVGEGKNANMLAFYEYNVTAGTLTPRPDVTDKAWSMVGDNKKHKTFIDFYMELNTMHFFDYESNQRKQIHWNTNEF